MSTLRLPRLLSDAVDTPSTREVSGESVAEVLGGLFRDEPGLRHHILEESGAIRPHVSIFVDGVQADLDTPVRSASRLRILHAVSGGRPSRERGPAG